MKSFATVHKGALDLWLYVLPLGLIFDMTGYMPRPLAVGLSFGLLAIPLCCRAGRQTWQGGAGLILALAVRVYIPLPPVADRLLLLAAHQ